MSVRVEFMRRALHEAAALLRDFYDWGPGPIDKSLEWKHLQSAALDLAAHLDIIAKGKTGHECLTCALGLHPRQTTMNLTGEHS